MTAKGELNLQSERWDRLLFALQMTKRSAANIMRFGLGAPLPGERIWIDPARVLVAIESRGRPDRRGTGEVVGGDWDLRVQPLSSLEKIAYCEKRWGSGLSWEDSGAFDVGGHRTREMLERRCAKLDAMMARAQHDGRILSTTELGQAHRLHWFTRDEILIHVGRGPTLIFGRRGHHRLAAAQALHLDQVPAVLGRVHRDEVSSWTEVLTGRGKSRPQRIGVAGIRGPNTSS